MTSYTMSFAQARDHKPNHPERTARKSGKGMNFDITCQVWPNRASMLKTIQIQGRAHNYQAGDWSPCMSELDYMKQEQAEKAKPVGWGSKYEIYTD